MSTRICNGEGVAATQTQIDTHTCTDAGAVRRNALLYNSLYMTHYTGFGAHLRCLRHPYALKTTTSVLLLLAVILLVEHSLCASPDVTCSAQQQAKAMCQAWLSNTLTITIHSVQRRYILHRAGSLRRPRFTCQFSRFGDASEQWILGLARL